MDNLYAILGVDKTASAEDIKKAWKASIKKHHPDLQGGSTEKISKLNAAYDILKDPEKRMEYDMTRGPSFGGNPGYGGGMDSMFEDLFSHMFSQTRRTQNRTLVMPISIEDICQGGEKVVTIKKQNGTQEQIQFTLPAGTQPGQMLRLNTASGQVIIQLQIKPHNRYILQENDIYTQVRISMATAIDGDSITVIDAYGHNHVLTLPEGIQSGTRLTIKDAGLPTILGPGEFHVIIHVETPTNLTTAQKKQLRSICSGEETMEKPSIWTTLRETVGL